MVNDAYLFFNDAFLSYFNDVFYLMMRFILFQRCVWFYDDVLYFNDAF